MALETEIQTFNANLSDWLKLYNNRVVLVRGDKLVGDFDNEQAAIEFGAREFGLTPFLVRRVMAVQTEPVIPALTLGLICGNPALLASTR